MLNRFTITACIICVSFFCSGQNIDYNIGFRSVGAGEFINGSMGYTLGKRHRIEAGVHFLIPRPIYLRNNEIMRKNLWPLKFTDYLGYHIAYEYMIYSSPNQSKLFLGIDFDKAGSNMVTQAVVPFIDVDGRSYLVETRRFRIGSPLSSVFKLSAEIPIHSNFFLSTEAGLGWQWFTPTRPGNFWWETFKASLPDFSNGIDFINNGLVTHFSVGIRYKPIKKVKQ
jgi:hypothetical protein